MPSGGGRLTATSVPLRLLILSAYGVQDFQLVGGPSWQTSRRFDIAAKAENPAATPKQLMEMLKPLLADRFQLKTHTETREVPIGVLVLARSDGRLGPKMNASTVTCPTLDELQQKMQDAIASGGAPSAMQALFGNPRDPCSLIPSVNTAGAAAGGGIGLRMNGQPMSTLVNMLRQFTGKTIQDRTGLTGRYDWELTFDPEVLMRIVSQLGINVPAGNLPPSNAPALLTALQEQLGLKLENDKGPGEVLVIDSAELPTPD
jgi:uncharacterized protein (TIGR03435 family)